MNNFNLDQLVRPNIAKLQAYSSARDEYQGDTGIFLDANENPFGTLNRYPDPQQTELKAKLSALKNIPTNQIFFGNGSDEVIDLAFRIFCEPGKDKALILTPTYGMYEVSANINNVEIIKVPLNADFQIDLEAVKPLLQDENLKLVFICSPNNPTGNCLNNIEEIIQNFNGIVFLDEAYVDFCPEKSYVDKLNTFPNLIISQTFSKARGLAAARVGIAYSSPEIIKLYNKTKPPYNISQPNQEVALQTLENQDLYQKQTNEILEERKRLTSAMLNLDIVKHIYPSDANFILVEVNDANQLYEDLVQQKIITRNRNSVVRNCIRITVGSPQENDILINTLQNIKN